MRGLPGSTTVSVTVNLDGQPGDHVGDALSTIDGVERVERITATPGGPVPGMPPPRAHPWGKQGQFRLYTAYEPAIALPTVLKVLGDVGCDVTDLAIGTPSLEDVFIHLTGRELR